MRSALSLSTVHVYSGHVYMKAYTVLIIRPGVSMRGLSVPV